jgi:transcriptional regulator with XRE-family HTH domain
MITEEDTGRMVRFHRKKAGLTRSELATLAGVGKTVVFDIENKKQSVKCSTLKKVLHVLNIRVAFESQLMSEYENQNNEKS